MKTNQADIDRNHPNDCQYALRRGVHYWALVFAGREVVFKHELGALYVAYLLLNPPKEPLHAVALVLHARERLGQPANPAELLQQRVMGLEDAASVRALWRHQRELERILHDRLEIEPVKAEAQRELEEVTEHLRKSPWLSRRGAERRARAVAVAIKRLHARLAAAVDAEGRPDAVLRAFALHLAEHLLLPSGQGCGHIGKWVALVPAGCFTYQPPQGVVWEVQSLKSKVQSLKSEVPHPPDRRPAAVSYLSKFLCAGFALALLATGCASPRPLKGGRAVITRKPAGVVEQTLVQSENPSQAAKQDQESVKVRTYVLPAGSRIEQSQPPSTINSQPSSASVTQEPSTIHSQPSTSFVLSAPMTHTCPCCGFPALHEPPRTTSGGSSYEICPSCGFQFGVSDDDAGFTYASWRALWKTRGLRWSSKGIPPPPGWNAESQLASLRHSSPKGAAKKKSSTPRVRRGPEG